MGPIPPIFKILMRSIAFMSGVISILMIMHFQKVLWHVYDPTIDRETCNPIWQPFYF